MRPHSTHTGTGGSAVNKAVAFLVKHPVSGSFFISLSIRTAAAVASNLMIDGVLIPDEGQYLLISRLASEGELTSEVWGGYGRSLFDSTRAFTWPLTALFWLFGPHRILGQLLSATFGAISAAAAASLASRFLRPRFALAAGLTVAIFPSQILWSSVVLRESMIWALLATMALVIAYSQSCVSAGRILLSAVMAGVLFGGIVWLRPHTALVAIWCLYPAVLLGSNRVVRVATATCLLVVVPWLAGFGPGGAEFAIAASGRLGVSRSYMSFAANSAIVESNIVLLPPIGSTAPPIGSTAPPIGSTAPPIGSTAPPIGSTALSCDKWPDANTQAVLTPLIDRTASDWVCIYDYSGNVVLVDNRLRTSVKHLSQGLLDALVRPLPWEAYSSTAAFLAGLEFILWVLLYGLAIIGVWIHRRSHRLFLFPTLLVVVISMTGAMSHGNLGTAFRHRGQLLYALAVLAVGGVQGLVDARAATRLAAVVDTQ
jgi:4-amino-4-deoxy-L-arabinose transferase-like glycosyltransferase